MDESSNVSVSKTYSKLFWIATILWSAILAPIGVGLLVLPIAAWYKIAVVNRTKVLFENDGKVFRFQRGRWFVMDDDVVPVKSIDNIRLNRSLSGKLCGWCDIFVETRAEVYKIKYVATKEAEQFRDAFHAQI